MVPVIFVLNGPRRSGKDTAAAAIVRERHDWLVKPLAAQMKHETLLSFGLDPAMLDIYELVKEQPLPEFGGQSFRDAVINYGDTKRAEHGNDYFGKRWAQEVKTLFDIGVASAIVMSDCRFQWDLDAALSITSKVLLYRIYRTPAFHNDMTAWNGDIGSWLFPLVYDVPQIALMNDGDIEDTRFYAYSTAFHYFASVQRASAAL